MRAMGKVIRRYVGVAVALTLVLVAANLALLLGGIIALGNRYQDKQRYTSSEVGAALQEQNGVLTLDAEFLEGYAWAMVLDEGGQVVWRWQLPAELDHRYTTSEVVRFSRWYLDDYPVMCNVTDYGTLVLGAPQGSMVRWSFRMDRDLLDEELRLLPWLAVTNVVLLAVLCVVFGLRTHRAMRGIEQGLQRLAEGEPCDVPERGATEMLAKALNQTGAQLRDKNERIARRDTARTNWVAGVSHDIRTPLALILGWAEQLEHDAALPDTARQKAAGIRAQSQRIKALVEDLNLTSKLQYNAQPLRRAPVQLGPLLRGTVATFCDSPLAEHCVVDLQLDEAAGKTVLKADAPLLTRAWENLLNNSARHNPDGCCITVRGVREGDSLRLTFTDDGTGYPPAVLAALHHEDVGDNAPHILGMHLVEQIITAHGGQVVYTQNRPRGARTDLLLPVQQAV